MNSDATRAATFVAALLPSRSSSNRLAQRCEGPVCFVARVNDVDTPEAAPSLLLLAFCSSRPKIFYHIFATLL